MDKTFRAALLILTLTPLLQAQSEFSPQAMLKPKAGILYTIPPNLEARAAYDTLGTRAGINMVYIPAFKQDAPVLVRIESQSFFDAMERLSAETRTFWFPWDGKTIILAPDTQQYRRDLEPLTFKTFYLGRDATREVILDSLNALRTRMQMRGVFQQEGAKAILVKDTAARVAEAERILSEIGGQSLPLAATIATAFPENATSFLFIAEAGKGHRVVPSTQSHLEKTLVGSVSVNANSQARPIYEDLAARAGVNVIFDRQMREKPASRFHVEGVSLIDALDLLAIQTATFWQPMNESTIFVMDDSAQNRRDRGQHIVKIVYLPESATTVDVNATMNVLRTTLAMRGVFQDDKSKAIILRDTPLRVLLAEKTIEDLNKRLGKSKVVAITTETSSILAENGWILANSAHARPLLEVKLRNKTTLRLNEKPNAAFEALAGMAGLDVVFDSRVTDAPEISFSAINVDILDALDLLAWQTRLLWEVVDKDTIRVIPDSQAVRRELEQSVQKTIVPADPSNAASLVTILRVAFGLRGVQKDDKDNIIIRDHRDNVAMAEKVVEILGKGAIQQ